MLYLEGALAFARSNYFAPDARVAGFLLNADIGAGACWGDLHGADAANGWVQFVALGVDKRNGYDLVKTSDGVAYVVVHYADRAKDRGLTQLRAHIAANEKWYAARLAAEWN